ncbi:MAG: DEAD/DEAH box helicase family protein [candidate division Zixibacteria bacterium]
MISLRLGDSYCLIEPVVPDEVQKYLTYWHRDIVQDQQTFQNVSTGSTKKLYTLKEEINQEGQLVQVLTTLPGFFTKLRDMMLELNYPVQIIDERKPRPKYDMDLAMKGLRPYQYECAYTAIWSGGGIIACPTGWGKTYLMGAIIRAHSHEELCARGTCKVVVITPGVDLAKKNYRDLVDFLPEREVGLVSGGVKKFSDDVQVVTPQSVERIDMEEAGIVIYDEVHTVSVKRADSIMRAPSALRFGLSATPSGRFDNADKVINGIFGPVVYRRSYQEAIDDGAVVPIRVYWVNAPMPNNWHHYESHDGNYRNGVWRNTAFHTMVGAIWKSVSSEIQMLGMVDKLEHMDYLVPHVEGSDFVHAETNQKALDRKKLYNLPTVSQKQRTAIYGQIESGEAKRIVSTGIYRQGVSFPQLTVLLNLAGMKSEIIAGQLPGRTSRMADNKEYGFIVDFWYPWDTHEKNDQQRSGPLLRDGMSREKVYRDLGFEQVWVDSIEELEFEA